MGWIYINEIIWSKILKFDIVDTILWDRGNIIFHIWVNLAFEALLL